MTAEQAWKQWFEANSKRGSIPCPDKKPGCCVAHFGIVLQEREPEAVFMAGWQAAIDAAADCCKERKLSYQELGETVLLLCARQCENAIRELKQ